MTPPLGTSTAPTLGLAAAAKACNVSESTLRRKRPELLAAGATQTAKGWAIPVPVLVQLGLMDRTSSAPADSPQKGHHGVTVQGFTEAPTDSVVEALKAQLAEAEKRAAVAEAIAAERERIIEAQALALRMLEAPKQEQPAPVQEPAAQAAPEPAPAKEQPSRFRRLLDRALR